MKLRHRILIIALVGGLSARSAMAKQENNVVPADYDLKAKGVLLQVTEPVPVFSRPDPRSAKLADADIGTVLLVVELSAKKTWAHVEDDEGTRGWVPVDRTDLAELLAAQVKMRQAELDSIKADLADRSEDQNEEVSSAQFESTNRLVNVFGPVFQQSKNRAWGLLYSLMFDFQTPEPSGVRLRSFGVEFGWLRGQSQNRYETRLRYSSRYSTRPRITYGPDVGFRFGSITSPTVFVAGYRVGYDFSWMLPLELRFAYSTESRNHWIGEAAWRLRF